MSDLGYFCASALTIVLVIAGVAKLGAPHRFRGALQSYGVIPASVVPTLVYGVPAVELIAAALQWVPSLQPAVSIVITAMFAAFTLLLLRSLLMDENADCGCFGTALPEKVSWFSIARNAALIAVAVAPVVVRTGPREAWLPAVLAGVGAGLLIVLLDQALTMLSRNQRPHRTG